MLVTKHILTSRQLVELRIMVIWCQLPQSFSGMQFHYFYWYKMLFFPCEFLATSGHFLELCMLVTIEAEKVWTLMLNASKTKYWRSLLLLWANHRSLVQVLVYKIKLSEHDYFKWKLSGFFLWIAMISQKNKVWLRIYCLYEGLSKIYWWWWV